MQKQNNERNFDTISPSAKSLLLLKGLTTIPFAKEAAKLISLPDKYEPDLNKGESGYWARVFHFEMRYWSINNLLSDLATNNILELSSGYSFRGLHSVLHQDIHYIDTDLKDVIKTKTHLVSGLVPDYETHAKGKLELIALNALDDRQFKETISHFSAGDITIVNEGLLMYLNREEKKILCNNIRNTLKERDGYWITADVYVKQKDVPELKIDDKLQQFFKEHNIEENKFESFEDAKTFFEGEGFVVDKEAALDFAQATSLPYLLASMTEEQKMRLQNTNKIQATWRLKLAR